jgi:gentisate 1,2-dioxygenase
MPSDTEQSSLHSAAMEPAPAAGAETQLQRQRYYDEIGASNLTPLWEVLHSLVPASPSSPCAAAGWRYQDVRPHLLRAGQLITATEAERRVLILENPALRGQSSITQTLYAGLQLLLPGEIAPSHRHTQSALRLVLEGEGAYTAVDGERTQMLPGDFVITPSMTWHDHGNPGSDPVVWLDGLDIPLLRFFSAGFAEKFPQETHPITRPDDDALAQFGGNLAPLDYVPPRTGASPLFNYRYARTRSTLSRVSRGGQLDLCHGHALRFINPTTGATPIPTIGTYVQLLPERFHGRPYRSTDGRVFCCIEGSGRIETDDWSFEFSARDVFVVPSWTSYRLRAVEEAVLFSFSDRPVQQALGLWREERIS